jgi:hypothetical protein
MTEDENLFEEMAALQRKFRELWEDVQLGLDDIERGDFGPWDAEEIKRKGRELLKRQLGNRASK